MQQLTTFLYKNANEPSKLSHTYLKYFIDIHWKSKANVIIRATIGSIRNHGANRRGTLKCVLVNRT